MRETEDRTPVTCPLLALLLTGANISFAYARIRPGGFLIQISVREGFAHSSKAGFAHHVKEESLDVGHAENGFFGFRSEVGFPSNHLNLLSNEFPVEWPFGDPVPTPNLSWHARA